MCENTSSALVPMKQAGGEGLWIPFVWTGRQGAGRSMKVSRRSSDECVLRRHQVEDCCRIRKNGECYSSKLVWQKCDPRVGVSGVGLQRS
jgi:hypothetical protein